MQFFNIIALSDPYTLLYINLLCGDEDGNFLVQDYGISEDQCFQPKHFRSYLEVS